MNLATWRGAVLSGLIFNAIIIPPLILLALRGGRFQAQIAESLFYRNLWIYGVEPLLS